MEYNLLSLYNALPLLMQGAFMTIRLWCVCLCISLTCGILSGALRCRQLRMPFISRMLDAITFVLRGVPFYVQLLIAYFVLPDLLHINVSAFVAATCSLGLCSAAYVSQTVRSGINALPLGQWEAAAVLGYSNVQTVQYIILPQLLRNVGPALIAEFDQLIKSTAIMSSIGILELTRAGMNIVSREMNPITIYLAVAAIYLLISSLLNGLGALLEKKS